MSYRVTRTTVETTVVDAESPQDALERALDYGNQYSWRERKPVYTVEEL